MKRNLKILVVNGPNLNLLGKRDRDLYGTLTLDEINQELRNLADQMGVEIEFFQSNHEGGIIDYLQQETSRIAHGVLINPGALIRYAYSFRQALVDLGKPVMEIHMSDIAKTGVNKGVNVLDDLRMGQVTGLKERSYYEGLQQLVDYLLKQGEQAA
ncbi:MAG: 3-dehydroquinate dehydratase [Chloroflexales bacterium]|nr:3-dehydroquinate dehydratase [Chloroflexales bacterium]